MRQNALLVAVAGFLSLTAVPDQVLAANAPYPHMVVDIIYNTPDKIEGDFEAMTLWAPMPSWRHHSKFKHKNLELSQAVQLADCYIEQGTWASCGYPVSQSECYCESWSGWALLIGKTGGLHDRLSDLLNGQSSMLVRYDPNRRGDGDPDAAARIHLGGTRPVIDVYSMRLARDIQKRAENTPLVQFLSPVDIPPVVPGNRES